MITRRPGSITTFAVLNLIFGCLFLICGLSATAESKVEFNGKDVTQDMKDFMAKEIPGYAVWKIGGVVTSVLLAVGFIVSGIGLLKVQNWGRLLALICAGLSIFHQIFQSIFQIALVNPALAKFLEASPIKIGGLLSGVTTVVTLFVAVFVIAYNVALLIVLLLPAIVRGFHEGFEADEDDRPRRRRRARDDDEDEYEDEYEDDSRRRRPLRRPRAEDDIQDTPPRRRPSRPSSEDDDIRDAPPRPRRPRPARPDDDDN